MNLAYLIIFSTLCTQFIAIEGNSGSHTALALKEYSQWFVGPLFTPTPTTVLPGHPGLGVVMIGSKNYEFYNSQGNFERKPTEQGVHHLLDFQFSLNDVIGGELIGSMITNFCKGASSTHVADSILRLGYQIATDRENSQIPDFRILFQETFSTEKYQRLDDKKSGTDSTGQDPFQTGIHCVF